MFDVDVDVDVAVVVVVVVVAKWKKNERGKKRYRRQVRFQVREFLKSR